MLINQYINKLNKKLGLIQGKNSNAAVRELFNDIDDEYWHWILTQGNKHDKRLRPILPFLPDEKTQRGYTGLAGNAALSHAFEAYKLFKKIIIENGGGINNGTFIMDFGCGWGRLIRYFTKDVEKFYLYGVDVSEDAVSTCLKCNIDANFTKINYEPPTLFGKNTFDAIYAYSVFSHLPEQLHKKWLLEFKKILKPGGILIVTTRPREFILKCESNRKKIKDGISNKRGASYEAFIDTQKWLGLYDEGIFCHHSYNKKGDMAYWGETCIPKKYVAGEWKKYFNKIMYLDENSLRDSDQNVIVAVK